MAETRLDHSSLPLSLEFTVQPPNPHTKIQAVAKGLEQGTGEERPNMLGEETGRLKKAQDPHFPSSLCPQELVLILNYEGAL